MDQLLALLTEFVNRGFGPNKPDTPRAIAANLDGAPAAVSALAQAMAANHYKVALGQYLMRDTVRPTVSSLAADIDTARNGYFDDFDATLATAGADGGPFDPATTLLLCYDRGGMTALGVSWSGGALGGVILELEEPCDEAFLTHLMSPAAFIDALVGANEEAGFDAPDLDTLRERLT